MPPMAFKHNTFPLDLLLHTAGPKIAHFKSFWELAWLRWVKYGLQ